jgi:hypothetical protein
MGSFDLPGNCASVVPESVDRRKVQRIATFRQYAIGRAAGACAIFHTRPPVRLVGITRPC